MNCADQDHTYSPVLYAHRGSMVLAPENTFVAFELALRHGAHVMEIDVRVSREDEVIVIHDERVDRTCNGQGRVRDHTLMDLKKLDAGYHFTDPDGRSYRQQGVTLMSLSELFEHLPEVPINIDIKDNSIHAATAVAKVIDKAERHGSVNVGSFHAGVIKHFRTLQPHTTTSATQAEVARLYFTRNRYQKIPFNYMQIPLNYIGIPLATPGFIKHAIARNIKIVYWTVNDSLTMQSLLDRRVTGLVTDRVDIAGPLFDSYRQIPAKRQ